MYPQRLHAEIVCNKEIERPSLTARTHEGDGQEGRTQVLRLAEVPGAFSNPHPSCHANFLVAQYDTVRTP